MSRRRRGEERENSGERWRGKSNGFSIFCQSSFSITMISVKRYGKNFTSAMKGGGGEKRYGARRQMNNWPWHIPFTPFSSKSKSHGRSNTSPTCAVYRQTTKRSYSRLGKCCKQRTCIWKSMLTITCIHCVYIYTFPLPLPCKRNVFCRERRSSTAYTVVDPNTLQLRQWNAFWKSEDTLLA